MDEFLYAATVGGIYSLVSLNDYLGSVQLSIMQEVVERNDVWSVGLRWDEGFMVQ